MKNLIVEVEGDESNSPIWPVLMYAPHSIELIAPEKVNNLIAVIEGIKLKLTDDEVFMCDYSSDNREIRISQKAAELFWAASYAYYKLYKLAAGKLITKHTVIDISKNEYLADALELFRWAIEDVVFERCGSWPEDAPKPVIDDSDLKALEQIPPERVASEICLTTIAYVLHHEVAHHYLGHKDRPPGEEEPKLSQLLENDADDAATDWLLDGLDSDQIGFIKRSLGIVVASVLFAALEIYSIRAKKMRQFRHERSHPPGYERLASVLDRHLKEKPTHPAWAVACVALKLHVDHFQLIVDDTVHDDFRSASMAYIKLIAEHEEYLLRLLQDEKSDD